MATTLEILTQEPFDGKTLRNVFAAVPSTVAVVTVGSRDDRYGATIGSLISLSLNPPLIGFAMKCGSGLLSRLPIGTRFGVSVLAAGQEKTARDFAASDHDRFEHTLWCEETSLPRIDETTAWIIAAAIARHVAGDHEIVVGLVEAAERSDHPALLFVERAFRTGPAASAHGGGTT